MNRRHRMVELRGIQDYLITTSGLITSSGGNTPLSPLKKLAEKAREILNFYRQQQASLC